ncbi:MAG: M28 family peptidase, partial [Gemmatimonadota bacterium]
TSAQTSAQNAAQNPAAQWWRHVQVLADDSLKGRDTGSPGHESASRYIAAQFKAAGLTPAGTDGWFQRVRFSELTLKSENVALALKEGGVWTSLSLGRDLRITPRLATGNVEAPLVFAGYGLSLPQAGVDDLNGLDVRGKIVVYVNSVPKGLSAPLQAHGSRSRWAAMQRGGALGAIALGTGSGWNAAAPPGVTVALADVALDDAAGQKIFAVASPDLATRLLAGSAFVWDSVRALAARGEPLPHGGLATSLRSTLPTSRRNFTSPNVVGILPGNDPTLGSEIVVYTAHSDHVGTVKRAKGATGGDSIFNGAMDNASGTATLIETARLVAARGGNKRTLAFVAVTAEEKGLLGSRYFAAHPSFRRGTIVADLNTDMFLPLIPLTGVFAYGYDESDLADDLDAVVKARGLTVIPDPQPEENRFVRSDQYSFIREGVPALAFKVGYLPGTPEEQTWLAWVRDHYHKVSDDTTQAIDFSTAAAFNALYADLAIRVANRATRPAWRANSFFATPATVP